MNRRTKSEMLLLLTAAIWGFAFVAQRAGMDHVGPFTYTAIRFALGSGLLALVLVGKRRREPSSVPGVRIALPGALVAGTVLFAGAATQQVGMVHTTAGKAGFITGLYVIIVPIFGLFLKHRPHWRVWAGAGLAAVGLYLLSAHGQFSLSMTDLKGDLLVCACAVFFALHVVVIGLISGKHCPLTLACLQFAVCAFISTVVALLVEEIAVRNIVRAAIPIL